MSLLRKYVPILFTLLIFAGFYFARGYQARRLAKGPTPAASAFLRSIHYATGGGQSFAEGRGSEALIENALTENSLLQATSHPFTSDEPDALLLSPEFLPCEGGMQPGDIVRITSDCSQKTHDWAVVADFEINSADKSTFDLYVYENDEQEFERKVIRSLNQPCDCFRHKDFFSIKKH